MANVVQNTSFLNLEKRNHVKKHIRKLLVGGSITTDPLIIISEQKRFYQDLYRTKTEAEEINSSINEFLNKLGIPKLSEEQKQTCEGKISIQECENVLDSFQTNKSPGNDGIPIEFYKQCWNIISQPYLESVNESFEKGEISNSQKQAVLTLIEKKGNGSLLHRELATYFPSKHGRKDIVQSNCYLNKNSAAKYYSCTTTKADTFQIGTSGKQSDLFSTSWTSPTKKISQVS